MIEGEQYQFNKNISSTNARFEFTSSGPGGTIIKMAQFTYQYEDIYNFGFGDWDKKQEKIDDTSMKRNGDADKILNTLGKIIQSFTIIYQHASIFVKGNTPVKHRWYQMNINKHLNEIENHFILWGQVGNEWHPYEKGKSYTAFLANRRFGGFSF